MFAVPAYITVDGVEPEHRRLLEWASLSLTLPASSIPRRRSSAAPGAICGCQRPGMDVPVALGVAAAFAASAWATFARTGCRLLRLGDDVRRAAARRALRRAGRATARRRCHRSVARARPATAERLVAWPARRDVEPSARHRSTPGDVVLVRPGARFPPTARSSKGARASRRRCSPANRGRARSRPATRCSRAASARDSALVRARDGRGRSDPACRGLAAGRARGERAAARRARRRPCRRVVRRRVAGCLPP